MTRIIIAIAAVILAACSTAPPQPNVPLTADAPTGEKTTAWIATGTLAEVGSPEWHLAPLYTRNAAIRTLAARRLKQERITVDTARRIQALADEARKLIDASRDATIRTQNTPRIAALQDEATKLLGAKP